MLLSITKRGTKAFLFCVRRDCETTDRLSLITMKIIHYSKIDSIMMFFIIQIFQEIGECPEISICLVSIDETTILLS